MIVKPENYLIGIIVFISLSAFIGYGAMSAGSNYGKTTSNEFAEVTVAMNSTEYSDSIDNIQLTAESDGFLAAFKMAAAVFNTIKTTLSSAVSIVPTVLLYLGMPNVIASLLSVLFNIVVIFGVIYLLVRPFL